MGTATQDVPTDEITPLDVPPTDEALAEEEAAFAGITLDDRPETPVTTDHKTEKLDPEPAPVSTPGVTPVVTPEPKLARITDEQFAGLLKDVESAKELKTLLEQRFGTSMGKIGHIEQIVKQLKDSLAAGESIDVAMEDLKELNDEYPDVAPKVFEGLKRVVGKLKVRAPQIDEARLTTAVNSRVEQEVQSLKKDLPFQIAWGVTDVIAPGWSETVKTDDFKKWFATKEAAYQTKMNTTTVPSEVKSMMDDFAKSKVPPKSSTPPPASLPKPMSPRAAVKRSAVPIQGSGAPSARSGDQDEESAFLAGAQGVQKEK